MEDFEKLRSVNMARTYNLVLPILILLIPILGFLGIKSVSDFLILGLAIVGQVSTRKAGFKKGFSLPFILCYVVPGLDMVSSGILMAQGQLNLPNLAILALLAYVLYIVAVVFFFLNARRIKQKYPTAAQDFKAAVAARKQKGQTIRPQGPNKTMMWTLIGLGLVLLAISLIMLLV